MKTLFKIRKARKADNSTVGYLSLNMKRWLPANSRHKHVQLSEIEADKFIREHEKDVEHYYFKTYNV